MSNRNHNYTNYSKPNKPAGTTTAANPDENVRNLQETENANGTTPPAPDCETNQPDLEGQTPTANTDPQSELETPSAPEEPKAVIGVVVNCEKLNIRAEAKTTAEVLCIINKGEEVEIIEEESTDDFYAVIFGKDKEVSIEGYCMKQYIKINN